MKIDNRQMIELIKESVNDNEVVFIGSSNYQVVKDSKGQYFIKCLSNGSLLGLTDVTCTILNALEEDVMFMGKAITNN